MIVGELCVEALRGLLRHKLRSLLTTIGVILGVGAVMAMVATGEGARRKILAQIEELGVRNLIVNAVKPPQGEDGKLQNGDGPLRYGLTFDDVHQIRRTVPAIEATFGVHDVERWIWFKSRRIQAKVRGVVPEYLAALRLQPVMGRSLEPEDGLRRRRVCVVRESLLREARYMGDPLALDLRVGADYYRVVGVLPAVELQGSNRAVLGIDDRAHEVYVPFETVTQREGLVERRQESGGWVSTRVELHQILCTVRTDADVEPAAHCIRGVMESFHRDKDWELTVPLELLASREQTQEVFNIVLPIIAGISLLVGGIGILNIMLASVTERTREIGIRRAVGASRGDVAAQFLVEAVTLTVIGGLLGVALGFLGVYLLESFTDWDPEITGWSVALALSVSCLTGVVFGWYPAQRAAAMDPIRALRHD